MAWFEDGAACSYFGETPVPLLAAGWLEAGRPYARMPLGDEARRMLDAAVALTEVVPGVLFRGKHPCSLCGHADGDPPQGYFNLWLPDDGKLWVAPELILHYVEGHGYHPPVAFLRAAARALEMGEQRYGAACARLWDELAVYDSTFEHRLHRGSQPPVVLAPGTHLLARTPAGDVWLTVRDEYGAWLVAPSPTPVRIDGQKVGQVTIGDGTVIEVGDETFRYEVLETRSLRYRDRE